MKKRKLIMKTGVALLSATLLAPTAALADIVTTIVPDGPNKGLTAMQIFQSSKLGSNPVDAPAELDTDPVYAASHVFESYDAAVGNVFQIHADAYGEYDGGNLDRQRLELKGYDSSSNDVKAFQGERVTYHWQFRMLPGLQMSPPGNFFHVFQLKASNGDSGAPVLTFTVGDDRLMFRHSPIGETMDEVQLLASAPWSEVTGQWLDATITVGNTDDGTLDMVLKRMSDGQTVMSFSGEHFDNWRDGQAGKTQINRPKWGIYRKIYPGMNEADVQYTGFQIIKHSPVNGIAHAVNLNANAHIEAESFFTRTGMFRPQQDMTGGRSDDAYMQVPDQWVQDGSESSLSYKLNVAGGGGSAYVHLYGFAPDAGSSHASVSVGQAPGAGTPVAASIPVGSWGWTTVPVTLTAGEQMITVSTAEDGMKLDKLVVSSSSTPPASYLVPKLTDLTLNGQTIAGFSPNVYNYSVKLPFGVNQAPEVKASYLNPATGTVEQIPVTQLNGVTGTVTVPVTNALEPVLSKTYTIQFSGLKIQGTPPPMFTFPVSKLVSGPGNAKNTIDESTATIWDYKVADSNPNYTISSPPIVYDLGAVVPLKYAFLAYNPTSGNTSYKFDIEVSKDNANWTKVLAGRWSSGATSDLQTFSFDTTWGRYVKYVGYSGKKSNGSLEKYDKLSEIKFVGDTRLTADSQAIRLQPGQTHQSVVQVTYADGRQPVTVTSSTYFVPANPAVVSVASNGTMTGLSVGQTVVQATYDNFSLPINVTVGTATDTTAPTWLEGRGDKPNKSQLVQLKGTSAFITWNPAIDDSGIIAGYRIYAVNGDQYTLLKEVGNVLNTTVDGLQPHTTYTFALKAIDAAGNVSDYGARLDKPFTTGAAPDVTPPVTTPNAPAGWTSQDATVTLSASDGESGVAKTMYSVNGGAYVEGTAVTVTEEGIHRISFYSVDKSGNQEQPRTVEVKIDKSAPLLAANLQSEYALNTQLPLQLSASDDLSGIASQHATVTFPDGSQQSPANGGSVTLNQPGVYTLNLTATNGAGLSAALQKQWTVYVPAAGVDVTPKSIKGNNGVFTVRVDLPSGYSNLEFDLDTVTLNGVKALSGNNGLYNQAKRGQFKFERSDFKWNASEVTLEFRGYAGGKLIVGQAAVEVKQ